MQVPELGYKPFKKFNIHPIHPSVEKSTAVDWSLPSAIQEEELVLDWGKDADEDDEDDDKPKVDEKPQEEKLSEKPSDRKGQKKAGRFDIMAQQLKFIACLQILMEELGTLATGCEVDGGQLRLESCTSKHRKFVSFVIF